ncbi:Ribosomal protein S18 acetylase RimI [Nonomuraea solani]|uniref:Ribosomal protein S18 acetylase RimI n=1 Tax=Nonomuraea solani TaxID=1144553 RepID=A0A1H5ZR97_9ACTN|nr:GNAT family N-acetyltransferase [Nonomuraea solani]SEG38731.1 Ribosomal protein S18 acetylase RimI [Nonomuraea solani]
MSFHIRTALPDDADAIETVRMATWRVAYAGVMPRSLLDGLEVRPEQVRARSEALATGSASGMVAVRDGLLQGFSLYGPSRDDDIPGMEVYALYVLPAEFSTGMGRALMTATMEEITAAGCPEAGLWVLAENARARRFYERYGFTPSGRTVRRGDPPLDEVHYRLPLAGSR